MLHAIGHGRGRLFGIQKFGAVVGVECGSQACDVVVRGRRQLPEQIFTRTFYDHIGRKGLKF